MILLDDKEILDICGFSTKEALADLLPIDENRTQLTSCTKRGAQAQLKKTVEWGNEECSGHEGYQYSLYRRQCTNCWQTLKKETGG